MATLHQYLSFIKKFLHWKNNVSRTVCTEKLNNALRRYVENHQNEYIKYL